MSDDTEKDEYEAAVSALHQKLTDLRKWIEETFEVSESAEISFVAVLLEAGLLGLQEDWISGSVTVLHQGCPHSHVALQDDADQADVYATIGALDLIRDQLKDRVKAAAITHTLRQVFEADQQQEDEPPGNNDLN